MNTHIGLPFVDSIEKSLQSLIKGKVRRIHHFYKKKIEDLTTEYEKRLSELTRQIEVNSRDFGKTSGVNRFDNFDEKQREREQTLKALAKIDREQPEKEQRDHEQRVREKREQREKEQRDREQREKEQLDREQREKEQRDHEQREQREKEQRDREQREQREKQIREQKVTHTFPIELKDWCDRAFSKCTSENAKLEMESLLRNIISESISNGTVGTKKWANQPIPSLTEVIAREDAEIVVEMVEISLERLDTYSSKCFFT